MTRYGIREVVDVTFRAKSDHTQIGSRTFEKDEPVIHFDTAKTGSIEGDAEAVYAQGGRGNPKLVTWEGEKTVTFTFEDALISETGMSILLGAELADDQEYFHNLRQRVIGIDGEDGGVIDITEEAKAIGGADAKINDHTVGVEFVEKEHKLYVYETDDRNTQGARIEGITVDGNKISGEGIEAGKFYIVDGYVKTVGSALQITPDKFSDAFYIEAETLFRRESDSVDVPAQFVIPRGKVQTSFNFELSNSGDPSTFTFTVDAMADYTKQDPTKRVLAAIYVNDSKVA